MVYGQIKFCVFNREMATASECLECKATPATVPLPCDAHFVCHECLVAFVAKQLKVGDNSGSTGILKCPTCHGGVNGIATTETQSRSYKDVLTSVKPKPPEPPPASHLSDNDAADDDSPGKLPGIWIFVHQSNMWIEAKKLYGRQKGFKSDIEDHRVRIDMGKLADVLAGGREEVKGKLYGSEPPPIDTVWKKIRERGWEVLTSQRSQLTGKEKQVDTKLVTDVISLACKTPIHERTTIILVTGDANVIPAIEGVLGEERWKVEVYMWANAISNQLRKFAHAHNDRVKVFDLDRYLDQVTFTNIKFTFSNPNVRSMVCAYGLVFTMEKGAFSPSRVPTDDWIDKLDSLAQWPSQYYWYDHKRRQTNNLVIVFRPSGGKKFDVDKFLESVKLKDSGSKSKYRLPLVREVQPFTQFIGEMTQEVQDPVIRQFDAVLEQVGIYSHDDVCAGYDNEASYVSDRNEKWRVFQKRHRPQSRQRYTAECPNHYNCYSGTRCYYGHSEEEMAYFKKRCEGRGNPQRKVSLCKDYENKMCFKRSEECDWAHGEDDAWCKECRKTGHLGVNCPFKLTA